LLFESEPLFSGMIMLRINGSFLYEMGYKIHALEGIKLTDHQAPTLGKAWLPLYVAESALEALLNQSIFQLRTSRQSGLELLTVVRNVFEKIDLDPSDGNADSVMEYTDFYSINEALRQFEAVLRAELSLLPIYMVTPKAGFELPTLIESGQACFPFELQLKVPEAVADIQQGTRCIAYELPTAAAFHLHRANESVLVKYFTHVSGISKAPKRRNLGDLLKKMEDNNWGSAEVRASLKNLKDYHRNPVIHAEMSVDTIEDAIGLMNNVHTVVVQMLKEIPTPANMTTTSAGLTPAL
jgi:hypothetical protein